ncbi:MAG TPA: hypothetical protein VJP59_04855, partial [Gemmatimonadota bacterium]|nr:hypothetical protein [Gemmatimonadota bacterium]
MNAPRQRARSRCGGIGIRGGVPGDTVRGERIRGDVSGEVGQRIHLDRVRELAFAASRHPKTAFHFRGGRGDPHPGLLDRRQTVRDPNADVGGLDAGGIGSHIGHVGEHDGARRPKLRAHALGGDGSL